MNSYIITLFIRNNQFESKNILNESSNDNLLNSLKIPFISFSTELIVNNSSSEVWVHSSESESILDYAVLDVIKYFINNNVLSSIVVSWQ